MLIGPLYVIENSNHVVAGIGFISFYNFKKFRILFLAFYAFIIASYVIAGCAVEIIPGITLPEYFFNF